MEHVERIAGALEVEALPCEDEDHRGLHASFLATVLDRGSLLAHADDNLLSGNTTFYLTTIVYGTTGGYYKILAV